MAYDVPQLQTPNFGNTLLQFVALKRQQDQDERQNALLNLRLQADQRTANTQAEQLKLAQQKAQFDKWKEQAPALARLLDGVSDQASWDQALSGAKALGFDVSSVPAQYDPNVAAGYKKVTQALMDPEKRYKGIGDVLYDLQAPNGPTAVAGNPKPQHVTTGEGVFLLNPDGSLGTRLGSAPREPQGTFGNGTEGRVLDILTRGNPASPEYATAYQHASQPRTIQTDQGIVTITPDMSRYAKPTFQRPGAVPTAAPTGNTDTVPNPVAPSAAPPAAPAVQPGQPTVSVVPGTEKAPKFSNEQSTAAGFANRISAANATLDQLESGGYSPTNARDNLAATVPGGNFIRSEKGQQYEQAKRDFVTAVLRKESGAAISAGEFATEEKKYFPQPGDGPAVIAQKRAARERAFQSMIAQSGEAYKTMFGSKATASKAPTAPSGRPRARNPQTGEEVEFDGKSWVPVNG